MMVDKDDQIMQLNKDLRQAREELLRYSNLLLAIQSSILPRQLPNFSGLDLAVHFADAGSAGGDFYDIRPVGSGCWAIVIADVSGHGLAAAAILSLVHALGSGINNQKGPPAPGEALAFINRPLATRYLANTGQFVTAFVGLYDANNQVLTYSSAGHPPPRLIRGNEVHRLDAVSGLPLGIDKSTVYKNETLQLQAGDRLVLFTDGVTESANTEHELFGNDRFDAILGAPARTASELLDRIVNSVRTFRSGRPAGDDETCLVAVVNNRATASHVQEKKGSARMKANDKYTHYSGEGNYGPTEASLAETLVGLPADMANRSTCASEGNSPNSRVPIAPPRSLDITQVTQRRRKWLLSVEAEAAAARFRKGLTLTIALLFGTMLLATGCKQAPQSASPSPPAVSVSYPVQREVTDYAEFTARIAAIDSTDVRSRVNGQIVSVPFQAGSLVQQGDLLVEIDVRPFQAELDARIADEARATAQVSLAQIEYERVKRIPPEARTHFEYDTAAARLEETRAAQAAAKAAVQSARLNVEWCHVLAPISGRISYKYVTTGNLVTGGTGSGTLLTTIVSVDPIYANFDVDERTVQRIQQRVREGKLDSSEKANIPVWLGLAAEDGYPHDGTINFVDNQVNPRTGTLRVRGVFPNEDGALSPGYFARVRVPVSAPHEAVLVSERTLDTDQGQKIVYIVGADNKVAVRHVRVGALHDGLREIADGLKPGEQVIVNGLQQIRPGATVEPNLVNMMAPIALNANSTTPPMMAASKH